MGITDGFEGGVGGADCSVGAIVWVRRRNGSWWPGRILGSGEVAASHLMSPRSGTPVKLLGREDASVDWYNLEKSKRVKAFRCGEFEECIERAETSQGSVIKKREKYARREDAILHALELERQQLEKKQQKLGRGVNNVSSKMPNGVIRNLGSPENLGNNHCRTTSPGNYFSSGKDKHGRQPRWEDPISESLPRMRGLQDIGSKIAPKKRKLDVPGISEGSERPVTVECQADGISNGTHSMGNGGHIGTSKNPVSMKRKNILGSIAEGSPVKRRDRRRPLVQVLQKSVKLPSSQSLQSYGDAVSKTMEGEKEETRDRNRSKRSKCVYLPTESKNTECLLDNLPMSQSQFRTPDSLTDENNSSEQREDEGSDFSGGGHLNHPAINEEMAIVSVPGSSRGEELDEYTGVSQHQLHDQTAGADMEVSKWQLKGKRNSRNLAKRSMELMDGENYTGPVHGIYFEGKRNSLNRRVIGQGYHVSEDLNYDFDEDYLIEKDPKETLMWGFGNRRYTSSKAATKDRRSSHTVFDSETLWETDELSRTAALSGYWDESGECFDPIYYGHSPDSMMESFLVEVDLKVQTSYQGGEHVPLVSLMSRLNGKAIVGHPVQVEAVEDGSSYLLCTSGDLKEEHVDTVDRTAPVPPVWRTGRRTVMHRVPRPHPSSALEGEEEPPDHHISDLESKPTYGKAFAGHLSHKARSMSKSTANVRRLPTGKKTAKKLLKKVSFSSQKTRMLSSIAIEQRSGKSSDFKLASKSSLKQFIKTKEDEGLILSATIVTCIPVKLVYSRLLEAVGRPPSRKTESRSVLINVHTEPKKNHSS